MSSIIFIFLDFFSKYVIIEVVDKNLKIYGGFPMKDTIKRYVPFAAVILAVYMLVPLIFMSDTIGQFSPVAYYFIFPAVAIICSAIYCSKYGMDFFFSLIAPVIYLPSMIIYNGGFSFTNIILLIAYLVASIFGLFIGDIAFGDKRRKEEAKADAENEAMLLEAKRRDDAIKQSREAQASTEEDTDYSSADDVDDFDYSKYSGEVDESEIDDILNEYGSSNK